VVKRFSNLKQQGSVTDYVERFNSLVFHLVAHHSSWDPLFFVTKFIEGLRRDIKVCYSFTPTLGFGHCCFAGC
jgi:hypothetical protein